MLQSFIKRNLRRRHIQSTCPVFYVVMSIECFQLFTFLAKVNLCSSSLCAIAVLSGCRLMSVCNVGAPYSAG